MAEWNWANTESREADGMIQTMRHLVEERSAHYFPGGMESLHLLGRGRRPVADRLRKISVILTCL